MTNKYRVLSKEELLNTYIVNDFGELRDVWLEQIQTTCGAFIHQYSTTNEVQFYSEDTDLTHMDLVGTKDYTLCGCKYFEESYNGRQLFLEDFLIPVEETPAPKTKTTYTKYDGLLWEAVRDMQEEKGEFFFKCEEMTNPYQSVISAVNLAVLFEGGVYTKEEVETTWYDDWLEDKRDVMLFDEESYSLFSITVSELEQRDNPSVNKDYRLATKAEIQKYLDNV